MTTKDEIRAWVLEGKAQGATHTIIACDTFDHEDYPVHVMPGEDARARVDSLGDMQRVMEVYSHSLDLEKQLEERRSQHYELLPPFPPLFAVGDRVRYRSGVIARTEERGVIEADLGLAGECEHDDPAYTARYYPGQHLWRVRWGNGKTYAHFDEHIVRDGEVAR